MTETDTIMAAGREHVRTTTQEAMDEAQWLRNSRGVHVAADMLEALAAERDELRADNDKLSRQISFHETAWRGESAAALESVKQARAEAWQEAAAEFHEWSTGHESQANDIMAGVLSEVTSWLMAKATQARGETEA